MHATLSYRQLGLHAVPRINKVSKINKTKSHHHFTISAFSWIISKFQTVTFGYSSNRIFKSVGISNMLELTHSGSLKQSSKVVYKTITERKKFKPDISDVGRLIISVKLVRKRHLNLLTSI